MSQTILVNKTRAEYEYDRKRVLRVWRLLIDEIESGGYSEYDRMTDDDRIIGAFELLNGSQFGDMVFGSLANDDQGSELIARNYEK